VNVAVATELAGTEQISEEGKVWTRQEGTSLQELEWVF
jgi:hypothetical protein